MLRRTLRFVCLVALGLAGSLVLAQEFSADVVNLKQSNDRMKKIYGGKDKLRIELGGRGEASDPMGAVALIVDEAQNRSIALMTDRHMYMEAPPMMTKPVTLHLWRVQDPNDACPQWKKVSDETTRGKSNWGSCTKIGSDTVNGRSTVKYQAVSSDGKNGYAWVDTKLHCVVKMEDSTSGVELRNIQEGSQPDNLFEIPAGYTKFDMGSMMQRQ
jgi:hypothetical protein